jgi:arylsulfatase A-like enzyme
MPVDSFMKSLPNILFLFTDQQRFDTVAALGNSFVKTPALDRLVGEGTTFTRCHTPSPVCVPARASVHTGRYPWHTGVYDNSESWPTEVPTVPKVLGQAGYRTHAVGKSHFMPDSYALQGFQSREASEEISEAPERDAYIRFLRDNGCGHLADIHGMRGDFYYLPQPGQLPEKLHPTTWVGDRSCAFIEEASQGEAPWMLYAGFIHPHPPWVLPTRWSKLYRSHEMPDPFLPDNAGDLLCHINRVQNRYKWRDHGLDLNLLRAQRAFYHGAVSLIDYQIGRLLELLDRKGLTDNTLIVFSSDHGEYLGDYGCYGKRGMHDVSSRVPLLARLPGRFKPGLRCGTPASLVDLLPTFAAVAGESVASDGMDLATLPDVSHRTVFSQYQKEGEAVYMAVDEGAKYVYSAPDHREYLFATTSDGRERANRISDPSMQATVERLRGKLQAELAPVEEGRAMKNGTWREYPRLSVPINPDHGLLYQDQHFDDIRIPVYQPENRIMPQFMTGPS